MGARGIGEQGAAVAVAAALAALTVLLALQGGYNHDEEQYVAAAVLTARGLRPILDFPYLQAPLQPWVLAPVYGWVGEPVFFVARVTSAALALAALGFGAAVVRRAGGSWPFAALAVAVVASSASVRTLEATARNDALPCALMAAGAWALATWDGAGRGRTALAGLAGLLLSLSLSAKLTYLFAPAAGGLWVLAALVRRRATVIDTAAFAAGSAFGVAPILATLAAAPGAAMFDMVGFHRDVTPLWYDRNGVGEKRTLLFHLAFWGGVPLREPPTVAAVLGLLAAGAGALVRWDRARLRSGEVAPATDPHHPGLGPRSPSPASGGGLDDLRLVSSDLPRGRGRRPERSGGPEGACIVPMLLLFAALAVVCASLPNPSFTAYAAPPVFLTILTAASAMARMPPGRWRTLAGAAGLLAAAWGWAPAVAPALSAALNPQEWTVARIHRTGCAVRETMAAADVSGPVATLSPIRALDCDLATYPEFAPGPFLFRSGDDVPRATLITIEGAAPSTLDALFARRPPGAILTGYEADGFRIDADAPLDAWARAHGFRQVALPDGGRLYLRPRSAS